MKTTPVNAIPYAEDSDAPDYPTQGKELAELLDTLKWGSRNLKPTVGVKAASGDLTLTGSYQDVPGAVLEITPAVASILKVTAVFDLEPEGDSGVSLAAFGTVRLDAEDQSRTAKIEFKSTSTAQKQRVTVTQIYSLALTAASHTIKLRSKKAQFGAGKCYAAGSAFLYELVAS